MVLYKTINKLIKNNNLSILSSSYHVISSNTLIYIKCHNIKHIRELSTILPFKLTDIGEGIAEVELIQWFVKEGDIVNSFDKICEVQSDKATVEITSRYDGKIITIHHKEGQIVKVGSSLVDIEVKESYDTVVQSSNDSETIIIPKQKPLTTPSVRKIAKEQQIDLTTIKGSGPKGRILKHDVINRNINDINKVQIATIISSKDLLDNQLDSKIDSSKDSYSKEIKIDSETDRLKDGYLDSKVDSVTDSYLDKSDGKIESNANDTVVPIRGLQRLMMKNMNEANKVQHLTLGEEVWFDKIVSFRNQLIENQSIELTYLSILIKITSISLLSFPQLNSTVNRDLTSITMHGDHNIGIAIDSKKGLLVPVIHRVQTKSIFEIAREIAHFQKLAESGSFKEYQLKGGTFTLSNIGSIGGTYAVPVLVTPQVVIGAFGKLNVQPKYVNKQNNKATVKEIQLGDVSLKPIAVMNVSWSADHRIIDGATIARFSNLWKSYVEHPEKLFAQLK